MSKKAALIIACTLIAWGFIWLSVTKNTEPPTDERPTTPQAQNPPKDAATPPSTKNTTPAPAEPLIWEQAEYPERLTVADLDMPLIFEGPISDELKQVILADLHLVFGHLTTHKTYELRDSQRESYTYQDAEMWSKSHVVFSGGNVYRPDEYDNVFGSVVQIGNQDHVVVPKSLVAAYEKAWERRKANADVYQKLSDFVNLMSKVSGGKANENEMPPTLNDLFHPATPAMKESLIEHGGEGVVRFITQNFKGKDSKWRMPSLLEIIIDEERQFGGKPSDPPAFLSPSYYFDQNGQLKRGGTALIYVDSRWKLLVGGP